MAINFRQLLPEAILLFRKGQLPAAEKMFRDILSVRPREAEALLPLALILGQSRKFDEAIELLQQLLAIKPYSREAMGTLAAMFTGQGRRAEAIELFQKILTLHPDDAPTWYNLGLAFKSNGQLAESVDAYRRALAIKPDYLDVHYNLGIVLDLQKNRDDAIASFKEAIRLDPRHAESWNNLGHTLKGAGRYEEAMAHFRHAMTLRPNFHDPAGALSDILRETGQLDDAIALSRHVLQKSPDDLQKRSALLFTLQYSGTASPETIFQEHQRWGEIPASLAPPDQKLPHTNDRSPNRRLRVGYVSADFHTHSVAFFLEKLLAAHDSQQVELFLYANVPHPDHVTERFQKLAHHWHNVFGMTNPDLAALIRNDAIDILVDLSGHTAGNRLPTFALKPAPIQVTYLGYPDTTGVRAIDYRLTDIHADPPGLTDAFHVETLFRLPRTFLAYAPPPDAPPVAPPPARTNGFITFGSFNIVSKITPQLITVWAQILHAIPAAKLFLKTKGLATPLIQRQLTALFAAAGIPAERLLLQDIVAGIDKHLALYANVDIALDTFPYQGTTTTCEALWMGVPVIAKIGQRHAARVAVTLLTNAGHPELLAPDDDAYVATAVALANDLPRLESLRATLRQDMQASPLMDAPSLARDIEAAYRTMWHRWCTAPQP